MNKCKVKYNSKTLLKEVTFFLTPAELSNLRHMLNPNSELSFQLENALSFFNEREKIRNMPGD